MSYNVRGHDNCVSEQWDVLEAPVLDASLQMWADHKQHAAVGAEHGLEHIFEADIGRSIEDLHLLHCQPIQRCGAPGHPQRVPRLQEVTAQTARGA
jgi:hypothetical protein